jgi:hypothetical protein
MIRQNLLTPLGLWLWRPEGMLATGELMTSAHTRFSLAGTKKVSPKINLNSESTAIKKSSSASMVKLKVIFRKRKAIWRHLKQAKLKFLNSLSFCKKMI